MASVGRVGFVLVLIVTLLVVYACRDDQPPDPKPVKPVVQPPAIPLTQATWGRIRFPLPTAWKDNPRDAADGRQILFDGPRDKGEPTISLFWAESKRTLEQWAEFMRKKYDIAGGPTLVIDQGWGAVGPSRAYYVIYEMQRGEISVGPKGGTHVTIDSYFQHDGHVGFLRCTSTKEYFSVYRPLFDKVARLLQFLPAPK